MNGVNRHWFFRQMRIPVLIWATMAALNVLPDAVQNAFGIHQPEIRLFLVAFANRIQLSILLCLGGFLGLFVALRHPILSSAYCRWLLTTPWHAGKPLPLGPVKPGLRDAVMLAILIVLAATYPRQHVVVPAVVFTAAYGLVAGAILVRVGQVVAAAAVWAGLAAMIRFAPDKSAVSIIGLATYLIAQFGMGRSLTRFPWGMDEQFSPTKLGWVYEKLSPNDLQPKLGVTAAVAIPLVVGWGVYCFLYQNSSSKPLEPGALVLFAVAGGVLGLLRVVVYGGASPISVWGRLWTGRLIIPGYDIMLIGPFLAALLAAALPITLITLGRSPSVAIGVTTAAVLLTLLNFPPTVRRWQLTGQYRMVIVAGRSDRQNRNGKAGIHA